MQLIVDQPLAAASFPLIPGSRGRHCHLSPEVYNNDDITFFSVLTFAKPSCDNVILCGCSMTITSTEKVGFMVLLRLIPEGSTGSGSGF